VLDRLEERQELRTRERKPEHGGEKNSTDGAGSLPPPSLPHELPHEVDGSRRNHVERALGVTSREREEERGDSHADAGLPRREAAQAEQEEREARRRESDAPAEEEDHVGRESPPDGPDERRDRVEVELAEEKPSEEKREKERESAREGPRDGDREEDREPRRRMEDRRAGAPEERVAREYEPVPQRRPPVRDRFAHCGAPGQVREREVGEDRVRWRSRAALERRLPPGVDPVVEIHRTVDAAAEHGLAGEDERQEGEEDGDAEGNADDEAAREPDRESRRDRVGQSERRSVEVQRSASKKFYSEPWPGPDSGVP
jgi:hypothetical protein